MSLDLEEAAGRIPGPTFIINWVLNSDLTPVEILAGDPIKAHLVGVEVVKREYGVSLPEKVDVVLSSAHPMDQNVRQVGKGLLNVAEACKPGGLILGFLRYGSIGF
jgi:nickel-dependent lactate racemase